MKPNWFLPIAGIIVGLLIGIASTAIGGYWVDAPNKGWTQPSCPSGFVAAPWGVLVDAGQSKIIYKCNQDYGGTSDRMVEGNGTIASPTPTTTTPNMTVQP